MIRMTAIFIFSFGMMYVVHHQYALLSVAFSPILILGSYLFFKKERKVWEEHEEEADKLNAVVQENLNGIRVVKAFSNEKYEIEKFDQQNKRKRNIGLRHVRLHALFWPLSDFLVQLQITISIVAGGYLTVTNQISIGELLSFYSYMRMVAWPMRQVGRLLSKTGIAAVATGRIYEILDAEEEEHQGRIKQAVLKGEIEFRQVCFKYEKDNIASVLDNISFKIKAGERVAIIGPTGAGKSTIINLLVGLHQPDSGEILLDGKGVRNYSKKLLREKIGVVLQTPFLFSTTLKSNIAYAAPEASDNQIAQAVSVAQVDKIEAALPHGYDTLVGEKGVTLSGGQKQRVALARTVLTLPDVLVLDDITSAVDTETEQAIFSALKQPMQDRTTIIISHRITSIQSADRILVLSNGKIVQEGTHAELSARDAGYYKEIHSLQTALEEEIQHDIEQD